MIPFLTSSIFCMITFYRVNYSIRKYFSAEKRLFKNLKTMKFYPFLILFFAVLLSFKFFIKKFWVQSIFYLVYSSFGIINFLFFGLTNDIKKKLNENCFFCCNKNLESEQALNTNPDIILHEMELMDDKF